MYSNWMLLICLVAGFLPPTKSLTIDDFTQIGDKNNLGFRRKVANLGEKKRGKFTLLKNGSITELLTQQSRYIEITPEKYVRLTYSSAKSRSLILSLLQHLGENRRKPKNTKYRRYSVTLCLQSGNRKPGIAVVLVPLTKFQFADLSKIEAISIFAQISVHKIELIDNINFVLSNPVVNPAEEEGRVSPILVIDNFSHWLEPTNILNHERHFSETVVKMSGSISLLKEHDYIEEGFSSQTSPFNLQYTALRIVYSSQNSGIVSIGILDKIHNDIKNAAWHTIEISGGSLLNRVVPIVLLKQNNPLFDGRNGYGVVIRGSITLHSLELHMNEDEKQAILFSSLVNKFEEKYTYVRNALQLLRIPRTRMIMLSQPDILSEALSDMDVKSFRMNTKVYFWCEDNVSSKQMFFNRIQNAISVPSNGLFEQMGDIKNSLRIIPMPNIDPNKIKYYRFIGRIIGMAIINQTMLMINFVPTIYKILLDMELDVSDLDMINSSIYDNLQVQVSNANLENEKNSMSVRYHDKNKEIIADLVPNGRNIVVGRHNQLEYEAAYCKWHADRLIGSQAHALREGLYDVIPKSLLDWFNVDELRHIMNGGRF